jgi:hypothetical protein
MVSPRRKIITHIKRMEPSISSDGIRKRWAKTVIKIRGSVSGIGILLEIHLRVAFSVVKVAIRDRKRSWLFQTLAWVRYLKAGRMA